MSIVGIISFFILSFLIIYQVLFKDLGGGNSLGVSFEIIGLLILIFFIIIDRILLYILKSQFWLSVFEVILIISYLINHYITHNNSFSIG